MKRVYSGATVKTAALAIATAVALLAPGQATASSGGVITQARNGCTCHTPGQSDATALTLSSDSGVFTVEPGQQLALTLQVAHDQQTAAGINLIVVDANNQKSGTLTPQSGEPLQVVASELTHTQPKGFVNGKTTFSFTWTAPATPGTYTLYAAGNAVNRNNTTTGDAYNTMSQTITVGPTTDVADNTGVAPAAILHTVDVAPNPAPVEGMAELRYRLDRAATVTIELYDATGRPVLPAEIAEVGAGDHVATLDTRRLAGGMYIAILRAGNEQVAKHFTVVR